MKVRSCQVVRAVSLFALVWFSVLCGAQERLLVTQVYGGGGSTSTNPTPSYKNDFVEIFNAGTTSVDLSAYSVQYGPSSTAVFSGITLLNNPATGSLAPGQYFLVQEGATSAAAGSTMPPPFTGAVLTGADQVDTVAYAAGSAKVALVKGRALLNAATGSCSSASIVSLVGYGTLGSTTCAEGGAAVGLLSSTTSATRTVSCTDTGSNQADFTVGTPTLRNSSTTLAPCSGTVPVAALSILSATASPASVMQGGSATLAVVVSPGSTSTGVAVVADLSTIGGSATQALVLGSTANTYTFGATVGGSVAAGSYALPVTVTDAQGGRATGSISLTVQPAVVTTPIATLQANRATYVGTTVQTTGVITVVTSSGWYMQTPSGTPGATGDEGLYVYRGSSAVTGAAVGNVVTVTGLLTLYPSAATSHTPSLELTQPAVTVTSTGNALPTPIALSSLTPGGGIYQLKPYEGMLVRFPSVTSVSGTTGNLTETTETTTSTGQFFATVTGVARPFREPGMDFRDFPATTCPTLTNCTATATSAGVARPANLVLYDDNPERLIIESSLGGGTALDVSTGAVLTNPTGVIDFSYSTDVPYGDPARLILLPGSVTAANYTPGISVQPLAVPNSGEVTIAAFNVERFFNPSAADNKFYNAGTGNVGNSSAVNVTAAAYARRLAKLSVAVRNVLNMPDVLSMEEVENVSVLNDISAQIDADATAAGQVPPHYAAYGTDSVTTFTDDVGGISIGFLVKPATVDVKAFEQMGAKSTFQASTGTQTLNDRPSDVLHVGFKRAGATDYPMTLISNHLRSLSGINTSADTRLKKELQAEMLATLIQGYQAAGEHVLAMGDMNAFEFSDGYTDTLGTITGRVADPTTVVQAGKAIVSPVATDLVTLLPAAQRQSYVEFGNAQVLDHIVATADIAGTTRLAYAHLNSDFPEVLLNDATSPARTSDHDAALAYVPVPAAVLRGTVTGTTVFPAQVYGATSNPTQVLTVTNTGEGTITLTSITASGDFAQSNNCGTTLAVSATCAVNVAFVPSAAGARTGVLTVVSNATGLGPVTLTGTAIAAATTTTVASGQTPSVLGSAVTFTATVAGLPGVVPTGLVAFADGVNGPVLGTATLANGVATFSTAALTASAHTVVARYAGSAVYAASSGAVTQVVAGAAFSLSGGTTGTFAVTVVRGSSASATVTVTPIAGFAGVVTLACNGAPAGLTCGLSPASLTFASGGAAQTSNLTLGTVTTVSALAGGSAVQLASLVVLLAGVGAGGRKLRGRLLVFGLLLVGAASLTGCGSSSVQTSSSTTAAGTYTVNVVATSGAMSQVLPVVVTVQ